MNICKITWSSGKSCEYEVEDLEAFKVSFFGGRGVIPDDVVFEVLDSEELGGCKQLPHPEDDGESEESSQVTGDDEDDVGEEAPETSEDEGSVEVVKVGDPVEVVKEEAPAPASKKKSKR